MNKKTVTFGEVMLRLSPENNIRIDMADSFKVCYGGAEANVAVSLANFGLKTSFVSKFPLNDIGRAAENELRRRGTDTSCIKFGGSRLGIYYCEGGLGIRPGKVIYDRSASSFAEAEKNDFNWEDIFDGAEWFHVTGITPALSANAAENTLEALKTAGKKGVKVSFDLNYRKALWSPSAVSAVLEKCMPYVDVLIANEEHAGLIFGIKGDKNAVRGEKYAQIAEKLASKYGFEYVALTARESKSVSENYFSAFLYGGGQYAFSEKYNLLIADRIGGGDSFAAGLIYALQKNKSLKDSVDFAAAAAAWKHTVEGDFNDASAEEIERAAQSGYTGRLDR